MQSINLKNIPSEYRDLKDIHTALAWNAIKKTLTEVNRDALFPYIKSVRLSEKYIIITTEKPIANAEIKLFAEIILSRINKGIQPFSGIPRIGIRLR